MDNVFWSFLFVCVALTFYRPVDRKLAFERCRDDWWIDGVSLGIHLWGLPLLQAAFLLKLYESAFPGLRGRFDVGPLESFVLYVILDYLWYWNHRLLHSYTWVWNLHAVHHSASQVDVFTTARNSIWSHFFEVYIWYISAAVFVLSDSRWFLLFTMLGSVINFWTHTSFTFTRTGRWYQWISSTLVTPHEHLWHHSTTHAATNFGTVFSLWDRLHGTLHNPIPLPESYGNPYLHGAFRQLVLPIAPVVTLEEAKQT